MSRLGRIPVSGDEVRHDAYLITVLVMEGRRVSRVRVTSVPAAAEEPPKAAGAQPEAPGAQPVAPGTPERPPGTPGTPPEAVPTPDPLPGRTH
jgi:putative hemolysin